MKGHMLIKMGMRYLAGRILLFAHNSSGFDSWVVLNSLVKDITELKIVKTARGLISLSFRCGVKIVNTVEVPQNVKFTFS